MANEFLPNHVDKDHLAGSQTIDFAKFVYSDTSFNGYVVLAIRTSRNFTEIPVSITQLPAYVEKMSVYQNADYYISSNIFSTIKRSSDTLFALNAIVVDIDCHREKYSPNELSQRIKALIWRLLNDGFSDVDFPKPNFVVSTGRGVHLWWCTVPAYAKSFGQNFSDVNHHFASKIKEFLAEFPTELGCFTVDPVASSNAAGFFRLPGTVNTHCGKVAEPIFIHNQRLNLKDFRDQFLPMSTRCKRMGNPNCRFHPPVKSDLVGMAVARLNAFEKLRDLRNAPVGNETRNNFCFLFFVTAKSIYGDKEAYDRTLAFNEGFKCPLTKKELKDCLYSARYKDYQYRTETIVDFLAVTADEARLVGFSCSAKQPSAKDGKKDRDRRIIDLFNQGKNQREIANELQISRQTVNKVIKANAQNIVTLSSKILELKRTGKTAREISSELGCSIRTVERHSNGSSKLCTSVRGNRQTVKVSKNLPIYGCPLVGGEEKPNEPPTNAAAVTENKLPQPVEKLVAALPAITADRLDEICSLLQMFPDYFADVDTYIPFKEGILTFTENDAIAAVADTASVRIEAAILGVLTAAMDQDGDLFIDRCDIVDWVNGFLQLHSAPSRICDRLEEAQINTVCTSLCDRKVIFADQTHIYLYNSYTIEYETAQYLARMAANTPQMSFSKADVSLALQACSRNIKINLTGEQNEAIITALTNSVSIITGGPGTGKTTIMAALYNAILCLNHNAKIRACAPTGKAAVRLTEVLGISAQTIHSLIGTQGRRIKCDYLIVDETSMVSIELLHQLLQAVRSSTHIIFVGDPDQLPCIGGGNPLRDMIASRQIPVITLHQPFRQLGRNAIIEYAHEVISLEVVDKLPPCSSKIDDQLCFIHAESGQEVEDKVAEIARKLVQDRMVRPEDIQVLSPSLDFCGRLNPCLREILNSGCQNSKDQFCPGDRIIYSENNYISKICNGQVGTVLSTSEKRITVDYNGHIVEHTAKDFDKLALAYAISVHKAHTSESDHRHTYPP